MDEQFNTSLALAQSFIAFHEHEHEPFLDQKEPISSDEVHIEHQERGFSIQVQDDDLVVPQERKLCYGGRTLSEEEMKADMDAFVQFWKARGLYV